jgi:ribonuclease P/MRP protein subunit RPP40
MGISGSLLSWIKSYLSNNSKTVVIGGKTSKSLPIKDGFPQGSILGPLLFLICVNDIVDDVETSRNLFADDNLFLSQSAMVIFRLQK